MTKFAREQWHKICALLMQKLGTDNLEITEADIDKLHKRNIAIVMHEKDQRLFIRVVSQAEGDRLAREEGGMPA